MTPEARARETAERMLRRHGSSRALEYAAGYAVGAYFQQTESGRKFWLMVCEELKRLNQERKS